MPILCSRLNAYTEYELIGQSSKGLLYLSIQCSRWILWTATLPQDRDDFAALLKPVIRFINETSNRSPLTEWYETKNWFAADFDARTWATCKSGFGTEGTPNSVIGTVWSTSDIWMIRDIELSDTESFASLHWLVHHDEDTEIFIKGQLAAKFSGYSVQYDLRPLSSAALSLLTYGKNRISVHCHQTGGGL